MYTPFCQYLYFFYFYTRMWCFIQPDIQCMFFVLTSVSNASFKSKLIPHIVIVSFLHFRRRKMAKNQTWTNHYPKILNLNLLLKLRVNIESSLPQSFIEFIIYMDICRTSFQKNAFEGMLLYLCLVFVPGQHSRQRIR